MGFCLSKDGFPGGSDSKESAYNAGDPGLIPGLGRYPGEGNAWTIQYSCLKNPMHRGTWWATVQRVAKSWTRLKRLSAHTFPYLPALEKDVRYSCTGVEGLGRTISSLRRRLQLGSLSCTCLCTPRSEGPGVLQLCAERRWRVLAAEDEDGEVCTRRGSLHRGCGGRGD